MIKKILHKILCTHSNAISFQEGMNLTGQPVVTFTQGDKKINFILDTGSTDCVIDSTFLESIQYTKLSLKANHTGLEGHIEKVDMCTLKISYKDKDYEQPYIIRDMSDILEYIKKTTGVTVHGLLGSNFFNKFKYVIDFNELIAYSKE